MLDLPRARCSFLADFFFTFVFFLDCFYSEGLIGRVLMGEFREGSLFT